MSGRHFDSFLACWKLQKFFFLGGLQFKLLAVSLLILGKNASRDNYVWHDGSKVVKLESFNTFS